MRINLRDLEDARRDPGAYLNKMQQQEEQEQPKFGRQGKNAVFLFAVYEFHKRSNDLAGALDYLTKSFDKFKSNPASLQLYQDHLTTYASEFEKLGNTIIKTRDNVILSLPSEFRGKMEVYGQIPRVDLAPEGYHVWLFERTTKNWHEQIRFPLIQAAYKRNLMQDMFAYDDEVKVGVYDFSTSSYTLFTHTEREIEEAENILFNLLRQLVAIRAQRQSQKTTDDDTV